jgi:hypothetical protein
MSRHRMKLLSLPAFLALLLFSSCEPGRAPVSEVPTAPRFEEASGSEGSATYKLIEGRIPSEIADLQVSKLIGIDGGSLNLAGHTLTVPAGAVEQPTLFTMTLVTNGYVEVDLSATATDLLGNVIDVGSQGFPKGKEPTLSLTYAWASNVEKGEEGKLLILRMHGEYHSDEHEELESAVETDSKDVSVVLDHFSKYCVASN